MKGSYHLRVLRSDPSSNATPSVSTYEFPGTQDMSVLEGLLYIKDNIDGTLAVNYSCKKQRCGSCALEIDGKIGLGCFTPLRDGQTIAPLPSFSVVKDLVVDWTPYESKMVSLLPTTRRREGESIDMTGGARGFPKATSNETGIADAAATCIRCFSCVAACPSVDITSPVGFAGPAISVAIASYLDSGERGSVADSAVEAGLQYCTKCFACNSVCPAGIDIVSSIRALQDLAAEKQGRGRDFKQMTRGSI